MPCKPGSKKFSKLVKSCSGKVKCIRYGDKKMTIKKHNPARKKSFCARHRCSQKNEPATAGYQSCKKWSCKVGTCKRKSRRYKKKTTKKRRATQTKRRTRTKRTTKSSTKRVYVSRSGRKYTRCWSGYKRRGWKTKNGRRVPNCVKVR